MRSLPSRPLPPTPTVARGPGGAATTCDMRARGALAESCCASLLPVLRMVKFDLAEPFELFWWVFGARGACDSLNSAVGRFGGVWVCPEGKNFTGGADSVRAKITDQRWIIQITNFPDSLAAS